jgi:glycosyltransferase involved in cell wall biosynthesis
MEKLARGIVCRMDNSGLGNQSKRMVDLIRPERLLVIDSTSFSPNKKQHPEWYESFETITTTGFPTNAEIQVFLNSLTHVFFLETPYNYFLMSEAKRRSVKVFDACNWEFNDYLQDKSLTLPHMFLMPSYWHLADMKDLYGPEKVKYLPPPLFHQDFKEARDINFERKGRPRFLHIVGTLAIHDRNGTLDLLEALKYTKADFDLVIRSQRPLPEEYMTSDYRVRYVFEDVEEVQDMYKDFDALIFPRRFGGLALTCNEALMSGLPVMMPDISPNNELLPTDWLIPAKKKGSFMTRIMLDYYEIEPKTLAEKIEWLTQQRLDLMKQSAFTLGYSNFSDTVLKSLYWDLWK